MTVASGSQALASDMLKSMNANGELELNASTELTIASGVIAPTQNFHRVDTQADAASDDLDTITLPSDASDGYLLFLRAENAARTVVIKFNTGNIWTPYGADITLDDENDWCLLIYDSNLTKWLAGPVPTMGAGSITTAMLAADSVDDTIAGNRVPQFYRRQGGSATVWDTPGTTTYTPTSVRMQAGQASWTGAASTSGSFAVTFPTAFSDVPLVFLSLSTKTVSFANKLALSYDALAASVGIYWRNVEDANTYTRVDITWLAIGPE